MDFADRSNGLRRPLRWTSPIAPMDFADRSDGLRRSLQWTSPTAPMDFADRSNGLRRPLQWTSPTAPMDFSDFAVDFNSRWSAYAHDLLPYYTTGTAGRISPVHGFGLPYFYAAQYDARFSV